MGPHVPCHCAGYAARLNAGMNRVKQLRFWLRSLFQKRTLDSEMEEEMRFHVEMKTAANMDSGMNQEEARSAALKSCR